MTKLYQEVYKLKQGAVQGLHVAQQYGQRDTIPVWNARILAYETVLGLIGDPNITPSKRAKFICKVFHWTYSSNCPNCGGHY